MAKCALSPLLPAPALASAALATATSPAASLPTPCSLHALSDVALPPDLCLIFARCTIGKYYYANVPGEWSNYYKKLIHSSAAKLDKGSKPFGCVNSKVGCKGLECTS